MTTESRDKAARIADGIAQAYLEDQAEARASAAGRASVALGGPEALGGTGTVVDLDTGAIVGALYHPHDGHIAPADLTMALRKGARSAGAEIYEHTEALGFEQVGHLARIANLDGQVRGLIIAALRIA